LLNSNYYEYAKKYNNILIFNYFINIFRYNNFCLFLKKNLFFYFMVIMKCAECGKQFTRKYFYEQHLNKTGHIDDDIDEENNNKITM